MVISIIALLIGILLPALGLARRTANQNTSSTQVRSIVQAMLVSGGDNNNVLPGRRAGLATAVPAGEIAFSGGNGHTVEGRYAILLQEGNLSRDILISPAEEKTAWTEGSNITTANYSYAMLHIDFRGGRREAWDGAGRSSHSVLVSDRLTGGTPGNAATYESVWSAKAGQWSDSVGFGDTHTEFLNGPDVERTQYGNRTWEIDDLFICSGFRPFPNPDAWKTWMVREGINTTAPGHGGHPH